MVLASARDGNVIGGGDWLEDRPITDLIGDLRVQASTAIKSFGDNALGSMGSKPISAYCDTGSRLSRSKILKKHGILALRILM